MIQEKKVPEPEVTRAPRLTQGLSQRPDPSSVFKLHPDFRRSREIPNFVVADIKAKAMPTHETSPLKRPKVKQEIRNFNQGDQGPML
jgi:hypothetical protein